MLVITPLLHRVEALVDAVKAAIGALRARWPWFDHLGRAYERYQDHGGDRLAAAMTSYGFLSFFPLLALAYALLGYLVGVSDEARDYLIKAIEQLLPGLSGPLEVQKIAQSRTTAGVIGLVALVFTGLAWVRVLRESLRGIWGYEASPEGNFFLLKLADIAVLLFLGTTLVLSVAVSSVAASATQGVLNVVGLAHVTGAGVMLWLLSLVVAGAFNTLIFLVLFSRLSGTRAPWRQILRGALFGAVGLEVLKQIGTLLVAHTARNPVYASFAVLAGLMVWINIVSRFVLFAAVWTATRRVVQKVDGTPEPPPEARPNLDTDAESDAEAEKDAEAERDAGADASTDGEKDDAKDGETGGMTGGTKGKRVDGRPEAEFGDRSRARYETAAQSGAARSEAAQSGAARSGRVTARPGGG
ncbi:YihY/virulence factor BrkB family protein [Actinomadura logoneensis]|uniref:YihY/virulence factor BrkB family protein n=1 Tax=Actinomadura logoneensis TaxID=2293572 RepID=A0A372JL66_9ACTN|nr:YihY/virulence factor BrkB family protein [Actinomadura logoneensis]RFU40680.1 YihY/virulence factor BrkB family protein [Actinomadura logoneensis]